MDDSFVSFGDRRTDNKFFREDREMQNKLGVKLHPSVTINERTYRGDINGYDVFKAVCVGFKDSPKICKDENIWEFINTMDGQVNGARGHMAGVRHIIAAICVILAINICALYIYRRYSKKKMNEQMQV